jgi:hypothetical protein
MVGQPRARTTVDAEKRRFTPRCVGGEFAAHSCDTVRFGEGISEKGDA